MLCYLPIMDNTEIDMDRLALDRSRHFSWWVKHMTQELRRDVASLLHWSSKIETQRPFVTEFESMLDEAEDAAKAAMEAIQQIRFRYQALRENRP